MSPKAKWQEMEESITVEGTPDRGHIVRARKFFEQGDVIIGAPPLFRTGQDEELSRLEMPQNLEATFSEDQPPWPYSLCPFI